jgi:hypothetical protein
MSPEYTRQPVLAAPLLLIFLKCHGGQGNDAPHSFI